MRSNINNLCCDFRSRQDFLPTLSNCLAIATTVKQYKCTITYTYGELAKENHRSVIW
ncbi:hypothetical protein IQ244_21645 [Nostoc sp. LEGE 06077]|nr:hypothetical protein [Nostoc sp. LEGE 06077]